MAHTMYKEGGTDLVRDLVARDNVRMRAALKDADKYIRGERTMPKGERRDHRERVLYRIGLLLKEDS